MSENKSTLISTVYNEENTIRDLLDSIVKQTKIPDETIIVDGGSTDNTQKIIQEYADEHEWINLIVEEGCNIAEGRNIAVKNASNKYIVSTDGGCILDKNWYERMSKKFEEAEFVAGMWKPKSENLFEKIQGRIIANTAEPEEFKKGNRGPSSRSVGFSKKAWEKVGGYPEDLYTGEDSKFNAKLLSQGYKMAVAEEAWVEWRMRPTWRSYFRQFYKYGEGDARGGNLFTHPNKKFGVSKNMLVTSLIETRILSLLGLIITLLYYPVYTPIFLGIFLSTVLAVWIYDYKPLKETLVEDGAKAFTTGLILSQMKVSAWYLGFAKECLRKPSLIWKQVQEWKKR